MTQQNTQNLVKEAMSSVPTDLVLLMKAYGIRYAEDILRGPSSLIVPRLKTDHPTIEVNAVDSPSAKRVAVAYELARWVLGREKFLAQSEGRKTPGVPPKPVRHDTQDPETRGAVDPSTGIETKRILWLASEILIPKDNLKRVLSENGHDLTEAAARFGVSRDVVLAKARTHKMIA